MPYGLSCAPSVFLCLINGVPREILGRFVIAYIDDNLVPRNFPVEQNYDISNWELLSINLVLEEWRHWIEGVTYLFTVFTGRRNLEYL